MSRRTKGRGYGSAQHGITKPNSSPTNQLGLSSTALASAALDSALAKLPKRKKR
jgi:hypothetical protein